MTKDKVLLVDDQSLIREALKLLIESYQDGKQYQVIGEAADGLTAIRMMLECDPDLILLDLSMPTMSGLDVIKEVRLRRPLTKIIALTSSESEKDISDCLKAGVNGFVHKNVEKEELFYALMKVMAGEQYTCSISGKKLVQNETDAPERISKLLSEREKQVLKLVVEGQKNKEISENLFISIKTVEKHRANLKKKLNIGSTAELVAFSLKENILN